MYSTQVDNENINGAIAVKLLHKPLKLNTLIVPKVAHIQM